ncbi:MAG: polysaccharide deacetylase family protein [Massilia sp.]
MGAQLRRAALALALTLSGQLVHAQSVALTFDDGPQLAATPLLSPEQRNAALLATLAKRGVHSALFVTAANGADRPAGLALARAWGEAGHAIGNHTVTHLDLNSAKVTLAQYRQEVLDCDAIISKLPGYQAWFRYTFLREGNTPEKRDGMRSFLRERHYRNAYVSLDTSDWRFDERLQTLLAANPQADLAPLKTAYLAHVRQRALAYRALSQQLQGRDIAQVMLLHHNLINALWLDDVIAQFQAIGWTIIAPAQAYADPVYQLTPERAATGQSLLLSLARSLGFDRFDGWARLVDDADYEMQQLDRSKPVLSR